MVIASQYKYNQYRNYFIWMLIAAGLWTSISLTYANFGIDWINNTDSGWYWRTVNNLQAYDIAIQPLYPAIVRGLIELFPRISQAILGQSVSLISYMIAVPMMYQLFTSLNITKLSIMTLMWAMFPLVGVTMSVYPRANALLLLFTVLCFWAYVKNNTLWFILSASLLPLIHRSALFFLVFLIPIAYFSKKLKWWMVLLISIPTIVYIALGIAHNNSFMWYFQSYQNVTPVTNLPLGDGIVGPFIIGFRGDIPSLIKGILVSSYFTLGVYMLLSRVWKNHPFLLATILPIIVLGLILPEREILSLIIYTSYFAIPFSIFMNKNEPFISRNKLEWTYYLIISFLYISQLAYVFFDLWYYGVL